jgi:hypothetical protein
MVLIAMASIATLRGTAGCHCTASSVSSKTRVIRSDSVNKAGLRKPEMREVLMAAQQKADKYLN